MTTSKPVRVLIAEDEVLVGDLIEQEVETCGMVVVGRATNGEQALTLCQSLRPDVVLMDIAMPQMDGLTAATRLQIESPTPVVILSAHGTADDIARATAAGVGAYLVKPPRSAELDRAITIAIARHADLMELTRINQQLQAAIAEVKTLSGLLPICSWCKNIRDDTGYWNAVEVYVSKRTHAQFSHCLCPSCVEKYFPGIVVVPETP